MSNNVPPEYINPVTNGFKLGRLIGEEREKERMIEICKRKLRLCVILYKRRKGKRD